MLINSNAGYKLYCETRKLEVPSDSFHVRIFTTYDWAKNPDAEQNKMELILSEQELENLRQSLSV
jgi:hypothetical protein